MTTEEIFLRTAIEKINAQLDPRVPRAEVDWKWHTIAKCGAVEISGQRQRVGYGAWASKPISQLKIACDIQRVPGYGTQRKTAVYKVDAFGNFNVVGACYRILKLWELSEKVAGQRAALEATQGSALAQARASLDGAGIEYTVRSVGKCLEVGSLYLDVASGKIEVQRASCSVPPAKAAELVKLLEFFQDALEALQK